MPKLLYSIPIYRCSLKKHKEEQDKSKADLIDITYGNTDFEVDEEHINRVFYSYRWYPWLYNEIVGWLKISYFKGEIFCDKWRVDKKRIYGGIRKKKFKYEYRLCKIKIFRNQASLDIYNSLISEIKIYMRYDKEMKRRYIDFEKFELIGKNIDWRNIILEIENKH